MIPDKAIELLTQEKLTWIDLADNDDVYWTAQDYIDAYEMAIEAIKNAELYEQIKWERDVALAQLKELGLSLGEKTSDKCGRMTARESLKELHKFVKLKTTQRPAFLDACEEALNKQIPQLTTVDGAWNYCPTCGTTIPNSFFNKPKYCHRCGQRIQLPEGD